jgi:hypothetical protein
MSSGRFYHYSRPAVRSTGSKGLFVEDNMTGPLSCLFISTRCLHCTTMLFMACCLGRAIALLVEAIWNMMAHALKSDLVFRRNGGVHLNQRGRQFSRLLAAEVCASAVVMQDKPHPEVVWRVLATPLHSPVSLFLPLPCVTVCHHISTGVYRTRFLPGRKDDFTFTSQSFCFLPVFRNLRIYGPYHTLR